MAGPGVIRIEIGAGPTVEFRLIGDAPGAHCEAEDVADLRILNRVTLPSCRDSEAGGNPLLP